MSEENNPEMFTQEQVQELIKSQQEQLLIKARQEAKAELEAEKLKADTTELVKSLSVVSESSVVPLVKALTSIKGELGGEIMKCILDMEDVIKAKNKEVEDIKAWFGPMNNASEGTPTTQKGEYASNKAEARTQELAEIVKAKQAEKSK